MTEALMLIQFLQAAVTFGVNVVPLLEKVSALIATRRAEGGTITREDLANLMDEGDEVERQVRAQFAATLADTNTPPAPA